uniref:Uncharacterized protein n=1 Tax=Anguilla anguilla TaxID=7936 RepID=A0A0E9WK00_ANGAN
MTCYLQNGVGLMGGWHYLLEVHKMLHFVRHKFSLMHLFCFPL